MVHDVKNEDPALQYLLTQMKLPEFPVALRVIRNVTGITYKSSIVGSTSRAKNQQ